LSRKPLHETIARTRHFSCVILAGPGVLWEMNTLKRQKFLAGILSVGCAMAVLTAPRARAEDASFHIVHGQLTDSGQEATLSNAVNYLQRKDLTVNIVLPAELGQIKIGDLQLRDAPADLALRALSEASGSKFVVKEQRSDLGTAKPLFILQTNQPPSPPLSDVTVQAFNLTGYLSYMKFDAVSRQVLSQSSQDTNADENLAKLDDNLARLQDIIKQVVAAQKSFNFSWKGAAIPSNPPTIKFYKAADLLIVIGSPEAVETARKIVNALPGESDGRGVEAGAASQAPAQELNRP
jgi:hypothetical protein